MLIGDFRMKNKLQKEFNFYIEKQDELVKEFNGKYLVIVGRKIEGAFDSFEEAFLKASQKHEAGSFLIQRCSPGTEDYTVTFYSNVTFG